MITDKDKEILKHIEHFGMCTANQIGKIFYKNRSQANNIARRRLKIMADNGYLKIKRFSLINNANVYIFNSKKYAKFKPTLHKIILLDYYAELLYNNIDIVYFSKEQKWLDGKIISDGFCVFKYNEKIYTQIIEVVSTNCDSHTLKKYNDLYNSQELQPIFGEFPNIILIDNVQHKKNITINPNIKVIVLDHELNNFFDILL